MIQDLFSVSTLRALCDSYGIHPSKQYGQHYLISQAPLQKMIEAAELTQEDTVVEVGPGFGVLTLSVAPGVKNVIAFEIEQKLRPYWQGHMAKYPNVGIVWGNALHEFSRVVSPIPRYKVVANLPYQITSDMLRVIFEAEPAPERVIVMVQKEVAERMVAAPPHMSLLSVAVQYYGEPRIIAQISKGAFWPQPKVDSAIVAIRNIRDTSHRAEEKHFFDIARAGFSHKRKQVWHNIAAGLHLLPDEVKSVLRSVAGNEKARAQELSLEQWIALAREFGAKK